MRKAISRKVFDPRTTLVLVVPLPVTNAVVVRQTRSRVRSPRKIPDPSTITQHLSRTSNRVNQYISSSFIAIVVCFFLVSFRVAAFIVADVSGKVDLPHHCAGAPTYVSRQRFDFVLIDQGWVLSEGSYVHDHQAPAAVRCNLNRDD